MNDRQVVLLAVAVSCGAWWHAAWPFAVGIVVVAVALVYALYIGVTCPCKPELYSCHLSEMYLALAVVVAVMVFFNGSNLRSYNLHLR